MYKRYLLYIGIAALVALYIIFGISDMYGDSYDRGYIDGFSKAEADGQYYAEQEYKIGYEEGYSDGLNAHSEDSYSDFDADAYWAEYKVYAANHFGHEAESYASIESEWHPEEALMIIECYENNEYSEECGSVPTKQDFLDAVYSLMCFYDYFYGSRYE